MNGEGTMKLIIEILLAALVAVGGVVMLNSASSIQVVATQQTALIKSSARVEATQEIFKDQIKEVQADIKDIENGINHHLRDRDAHENRRP